MKKTLLVRIPLVLLLASLVIAFSGQKARPPGFLQTHSVAIQEWGEYFPVIFENEHLKIDRIKFGKGGKQVMLIVENKTSNIINLDINIAGFERVTTTKGRKAQNLIGVGFTNGVVLRNKERLKVNIEWRRDSRLIPRCEFFSLSVHSYK